jgi:protein-S-isoprenylcysteine O-methyltransferase Ste14
VWALQRPFGTTIVPASRLGALLLLALAATLALFGAWLASAAVRALGRQWSLTARVVEEHALITTGPYAIVRHPIYTSMFLLLVATGVALSHWIGLLLGAAVFVAGTVARIRVEDRLLSQELGEPYRQYAARVPALFPWPRKPAV